MTAILPSVTGARFDTAPLGTGSNWVTHTDPVEGVGLYVRAIAHALMRERGMSESAAIATALAAVKRWAAGGGHVHPEVRARAVAAVAHWERLKAFAHAKALGADAASGKRNWAKWDAEHGISHGGRSTRFLAGSLGVRHKAAAEHPDFDKHARKTEDTIRRLDTPTSLLHHNWGESVAKAKAAQDHKQPAAVARHLGEAVAIEHVLRERGEIPRYGTTTVDPSPQFRDGIGEWGPSGPPTTDASGSANLLPTAPIPKPSKPEEATSTPEPHRFKGADLTSCVTCGRPVADRIHRRSTSGTRHAGPGHAPVPSGHIKRQTRRIAQASQRQHEKDQSLLEEPLTAAMQRFFEDQRASTVARLHGKRGKQMLKKAGVRADVPEGGAPVPGSPPPVGTAGVVSPAPITVAAGGTVALDPSAIFDGDFWNKKLAELLQPYYDSAAALSGKRIGQTLELPPEFDDHQALSAARQLLADRGNMTSPKINETTYREIVKQLQEAVAQGEGLGAMTKRVNATFDTANRVRAQRIAQTETIAALNGSSHAYANALPEGIVGSKTWKAHHDERTRPAHRMADGQSVPVNAPFYVDGYPMMYPGDPAAPPGLIVNCRCGVAYLPPGLDNGKLTLVAKQMHADIAAALGVDLSPEAATYLIQPPAVAVG